MPRRSRWWIWSGRVAFAGTFAGLIIYLTSVGLEKADKIASSVGVVVALIALAAPYLLRAPEIAGDTMISTDRVEDSGSATANNGGQANSGVRGASRDRPANVTRSGDARADGQGSVANTGIQSGPQK